MMDGEATTRSIQNKEGIQEDSIRNRDKMPTDIPIKDKPTTNKPTTDAEDEAREDKNEQEEQNDYKNHQPDSLEQEMEGMLNGEEDAVREAADNEENKEMHVGTATSGTTEGERNPWSSERTAETRISSRKTTPGRKTKKKKTECIGYAADGTNQEHETKTTRRRRRDRSWGNQADQDHSQKRQKGAQRNHRANRAGNIQRGKT